MHYAFRVAYDGTRYEGWQKQAKTEATIQGKLEKALAELSGEPVQVIGAGRTDAGVHARGQYADAHIPLALSPEELEETLNGLLPDDIAVSAMRIASDRFHSRFSAKEKWYRYRIRTGYEKDVFARRYVWQLAEALDTAAMRRAAKDLEGTHDFTSFCGNKHFKKSPIRAIKKIAITEEAGELILDFYGNGFLQNMVRILTGTLVEIGEGKRSASGIPAILEARDRSRAGFTAPALGLCLMDVMY